MHNTVDFEDFPVEVRNAIRKVLRDRFGAQFVSMSIVDFEVSDAKCTVVIEIELCKRPTDNRANDAPSLFGLTRQVRNAMGHLGNGVFPVLRPIAHCA